MSYPDRFIALQSARLNATTRDVFDLGNGLFQADVARGTSGRQRSWKPMVLTLDSTNSYWRPVTQVNKYWQGNYRVVGWYYITTPAGKHKRRVCTLDVGHDLEEAKEFMLQIAKIWAI